MTWQLREENDKDIFKAWALLADLTALEKIASQKQSKVELSRVALYRVDQSWV